MNPTDALFAAKSARDTVRNAIVRELARDSNLSYEMRALLQADALATADLVVALQTRRLDK